MRVFYLVVLFFSAACTSQTPKPLTASSADQSGYATEYPSELAGLRGELSDIELTVGQRVGEFPTYPSELDDPAWAEVSTVVRLADRDGRGARFAEAHSANHRVVVFFERDGKVIKQKVGGSAQQVAKGKGCDVELYGPTAGALDRSVDKALEDHLASQTEASIYLDDNADHLGPRNYEKLKEQAARLAHTSYLAHVAMEQSARDLDQRVKEASTVKNTLERSIEEAKASEAVPGRPKADVARTQKRREAAEQALAKLDAEVKQAEHVLLKIQERIAGVQQRYEKALEALTSDLEERAKRAEGSGK